MEKLTESEVLSLLKQRLPAEVRLAYRTEKKSVESQRGYSVKTKNVNLFIMIPLDGKATYAVFVDEDGVHDQFTGLNLSSAVEKYNEA